MEESFCGIQVGKVYPNCFPLGNKAFCHNLNFNNLFHKLLLLFIQIDHNMRKIMKYKTTVEVNQKGNLVMTDGKLSQTGDMTFAYQALLEICRDQEKKGNVFQNGNQFTVRALAEPGLYSERLQVSINQEFVKDAIAVLEKQYPGLQIQNKPAEVLDNTPKFP